jgi:hypothetical protein
MSVINTLENVGHAAMTAVEHAAAWLVGTIATAETSLASLEATSPLVAEAIAAGEASAQAHGVPITAIADAGSAVLTAAKELAADLSSAPAVAPARRPTA